MNDIIPPSQPVPPPVSAPPAVQPLSFGQRLMRKLVGGCLILVVGFCALGVLVAAFAKKPGQPGSQVSARPTAQWSKQEWRSRVVKELDQNMNVVIAGFISCQAKDFYRVMGKPSRTQSIGDNALLYYPCTDGTLQLVCSKLNLEANGLLGTTAINEY